MEIIRIEGAAKEQFEKRLRDLISGGEIHEDEDSTNLHLTQSEFIARMRQEPDGQALLDLMESGEWRVCERMGLCEAYWQEHIPYIDVPAWNNLLAHLRIVV